MRTKPMIHINDDSVTSFTHSFLGYAMLVVVIVHNHININATFLTCTPCQYR